MLYVLLVITLTLLLTAIIQVVTQHSSLAGIAQQLAEVKWILVLGYIGSFCSVSDVL